MPLRRPPHFERIIHRQNHHPHAINIHSSQQRPRRSSPAAPAALQCGRRKPFPPAFLINPPEGTKSFAITIHDPDAPTGSGFWHWLAVNLPSSVRELPSGAGDPALGLMPEQTVQIRNDAGFAGYSGSFPPAGHGWHLYLVTVYALDTDSLPVAEDTPAAQVGFQLWQHTLQKASIVFYDRVETK